MADGEILGPVLWVAQTEELCEQAVSAWAENWRAHGSRERLRVSRLWSGNEAAESDIAHQVVVATDAKLGVVIERGDGSYDWLSKAGAVVIDEAHSAVSPAYTTILDWLGMGREPEPCAHHRIVGNAVPRTSEVETESVLSSVSAVTVSTTSSSTRIPCFRTWEFCRMCVTWSCPVQTLN